MVRAMSDDLYNDARWLVGAIARGLHARGGPHVDVVLQRLAEQDMESPRPQLVILNESCSPQPAGSV